MSSICHTSCISGLAGVRSMSRFVYSTSWVSHAIFSSAKHLSRGFRSCRSNEARVQGSKTNNAAAAIQAYVHWLQTAQTKQPNFKKVIRLSLAIASADRGPITPKANCDLAELHKIRDILGSLLQAFRSCSLPYQAPLLVVGASVTNTARWRSGLRRSKGASRTPVFTKICA